MKKQMKWLCVLLLIAFTQCLAVVEIPMHDLKLVADGLNRPLA
jgi:hypothetical protein